MDLTEEELDRKSGFGLKAARCGHVEGVKKRKIGVTEKSPSRKQQ